MSTQKIEKFLPLPGYRTDSPALDRTLRYTSTLITEEVSTEEVNAERFGSLMFHFCILEVVTGLVNSGNVLF